MTTDLPRIRDVYREYQLGRIPFQDVIAAADRFLAEYEKRPDRLRSDAGAADDR
jgi:hypothetical protein